MSMLDEEAYSYNMLLYSTSACVATNNCHKAVIDVPDMRCDRSVSPTIISGRAPRPSQPDFIAAV